MSCIRGVRGFQQSCQNNADRGRIFRNFVASAIIFREDYTAVFCFWSMFRSIPITYAYILPSGRTKWLYLVKTICTIEALNGLKLETGRMKEIHNFSEMDAVVGSVVMKTTELVRAWGADVVKVNVKSQDENGGPHIYVQNSDGRVIEVFVRDKLEDGRQFIDYEIYSIGGNDYEQWHASSPEMFFSAIDGDIQRLSLAREMRGAFGLSC